MVQVYFSVRLCIDRGTGTMPDDVVDAAWFIRKFLESEVAGWQKTLESFRSRKKSMYSQAFDTNIVALAKQHLLKVVDPHIKLEFIVASRIEDATRRPSTSFFTTSTCQVLVDAHVQPQERLYWTLHETAHILHSVQRALPARSYTDDIDLRALNFVPRQLGVERTNFEAASLLYQDVYETLELPIKGRKRKRSSILIENMWERVEGIVRRTSEQSSTLSAHIPTNPFYALDDEAKRYVEQSLNHIDHSLTAVQESLQHMEAAIEEAAS